MLACGIGYSIKNMLDYRASYYSSESYVKGMIVAGVSGFAKGATIGLGVSVKYMTLPMAVVNPTVTIGGMVFESIMKATAEYVEVGVEEAGRALLLDEPKEITKPRRKESITEANIGSTTEVGITIIESIGGGTFDPFFSEAIKEARQQRAWLQKIEKSVDHSYDWIESKRY